MNGRSFHVVIAGGGLGGLCLAQGLKKAGVSVAVYERDRTRTDRLQGYRIHIDPNGSRALYECLPANLFEAFDSTGGVGTR
jgi:2-polyprenyl-6-methoxyphenol hydroxylase-like FAD-dependent oxidoreductase